MAKTITTEELAKHNKEDDLWVAVAGDVYDVSNFAAGHPGGSKLLEQYAGMDVSSEFFELHRKDVLKKYTKLVVGRLEGAVEDVVAPDAISLVPFGDAPAFQGGNSPYYTDGHKTMQKSVRKWVTEVFAPEALANDLKGSYPSKKIKKAMAMAGMLITRLGPGPWLQQALDLGISLPEGCDPATFDYFNEMIVHQELARVGTPGYLDGCGGGYLISYPCIKNFGSPATQASLGKSLMLGDKISCLAISEPFAGSDVAGIRLTGEKSACGKFWVLNGIKKWITEGMTSDVFVTAVRTGGKGHKGVTLMAVERCDEVVTTQIKTTYSTSAGTALVLYEDVEVPVENVLGKEGDGFRLIMYNFNHERWMIVQNLLGLARAAFADAICWAKQRKVFGKSLVQQPVIRNKLANSAAALESTWTYLEAITYDMCKSKGGPLNPRLAGPIAMLKYHATRSCWQIADDTVQIMGGRGITKTGMGSKVENFKNFAKYAAVYGGSEEIMADLAIKQALKTFPDSIGAKL